MPTGTLSGKAKRLWESVFEQAKKSGLDEKDADSRAWEAVKRSYKEVGDTWVRKENSGLEQFSLTIKRVTKDENADEYKWRADTSDTELDLYGDKMSLSLYADFIDRIEKKVPPPTEYCSDFWDGGLPYLSLSHYPDANGEAVPGDVAAVFVDGKFLRAKGTFNRNPLGEACWRTIYSEFASEAEDKVGISIAFLDYKHKHLSELSQGYVFERKSLDDVCPMCLAEMFLGEADRGKEFLEGHLIHLALTRVPVNQRTLMEVDKSMTTQKEDAASIVGPELADQIEEKVKELSVGKAALTIKSENGEQTFEFNVPGLVELRADVAEVLEILRKKKDKDMEDEEDDEEMSDKKKKAPPKEKSEPAAEEEQIVGVDPVLALADSISKGMVALTEGLGQKMDILIAANSQKVNVQTPQPIGMKSSAQMPGRPTPGKPLSVDEYIKLQFGV